MTALPAPKPVKQAPVLKKKTDFTVVDNSQPNYGLVDNVFREQLQMVRHGGSGRMCAQQRARLSLARRLLTSPSSVCFFSLSFCSRRNLPLRRLLPHHEKLM